MSTIVYHGMQSCIESQIIETTILKLKVSPIITSTDNKCHIQESIKTPKNISNITPTPIEKQSTYIHPLTKTTPRLSQKSLELCTEHLGSETGSDDGMDIDILSLNDVVENSTRKELVHEEQEKNVTLKLESRISRKENFRSFPPPLTSIRCSNSIQCRPYREDGRLIIEAIELPSRNTYLHAERSNGRLRLSFINEGGFEKDSVVDCYESEEEEEDEEEEEEEVDDDVEVKNDINMEEEIIGSKIGVEGEIGIEKFKRLSRCIEGGYVNRNLCNWGNSLWVATS